MTDWLNTGDVIEYPYRWLREAADDRSPDGAKDRPCCCVLRVQTVDGDRLVYLIAISSKGPGVGQKALPIPPIERRRVGLDADGEAWVYVSEVNSDRLNGSWYLEPQTPRGRFSAAFFRRIAEAVVSGISASRVVRRAD